MSRPGEDSRSEKWACESSMSGDRTLAATEAMTSLQGSLAHQLHEDLRCCNGDWSFRR